MVAFAITEALVPSVEIDGGLLGLIGVAALFGLVNAIIGPLLRLLSIPLLLITFGLFALVINAVLLFITAGLTDALDVGGFFSTVVRGGPDLLHLRGPRLGGLPGHHTGQAQGLGDLSMGPRVWA